MILARRAIAIRKRLTEWFKQQTTTDGAEDSSGKTHEHFINVLEEVVQILDPLCERDDTTTKSAATGRTSSSAPQEETLVNVFSVLDIEEAEDKDLSKTLLPPPKVTTLSTTISTIGTTPRVGQVEVDHILEEEDADDLLAIFCFLRDLRFIRDFLRDTGQATEIGKSISSRRPSQQTWHSRSFAARRTIS